MTITGDTARWFQQMRDIYVDKQKGPCHSDTELLDHLRRCITDPQDIFLSELTALDDSARAAMDKEQYAVWAKLQAHVRQLVNGYLEAASYAAALDLALDEAWDSTAVEGGGPESE